MANKTIRYKAISCSVAETPYSATSTATLRVHVRTKGGHYHDLLISNISVHDAMCIRSTANVICAKFKDLVAALHARL